MTDTLTLLDQTELFQLALSAGAAGDSASALAYLKTAVARVDATASAHYLLGAEYAQLKLYDRAMDEMEAALALDPALWTARIQLALLYLAASRAERAVDVLGPLAQQNQDQALQRFGAGLLCLASEDLQGARIALTEGIGLNDTNPALNGDMQRIVDEIGQRLGAPDGGDEADDEVDARLLLSAYAGNQAH